MLFLLMILSVSVASAVQKAVFIAPVSDLFADQLSVHHPHHMLSRVYRSSPIMGIADGSCYRTAQALFNDVVDIVDLQKHEIAIRSGRYFFDTADGTCMTRLWAYRKNIALLKDIPESFHVLFPSQPSFYDSAWLSDPNVVTLAQGWKDPESNLFFSAGTRFVREPERDTETQYGIAYFHARHRKKHQSLIARDMVTVPADFPDNQSKQQQCVALLRVWANNSVGFSPYVWGGMSMGIFLENDEFAEHQRAPFGKFWFRWGAKPPYFGCDCSGLFVLAAQICEIPYFYRNTRTIVRCLKPFSRQDQLEAGDIIWFPGHVMMVSDIQNNLIIESKGYAAGYGKLHEAPLSERFSGVTTFDDLIQKMRAHQKTGELHKDGRIMRYVKPVIFKFSSVFEKDLHEDCARDRA